MQTPFMCALMGKTKMRIASVERNTRETKISLEINLDGRGENQICTGIGFFDHMLTALSRHSFIDMKLRVDGDLEVDTHHTIEDTGIVIGEAIRKALGDKMAIRRYGSCILPMDEALVLCAVDLSDRPYLQYDLQLDREFVGNLETEMVREFFYALSYSARMNLHIKEFSGVNNHHKIEVAFKALARALKEAVSIDESIQGVLSTKGIL